ncbi:hypothetical protein Pmani_026789 [Petrolisthes manimaculis]|uniref:UBX domain-containing protein 1 n=1 Tax=Petrolisthes manimaculis TaxID=1843537 RepID=A0AAE1TZS7_9EUCA|nr:hypothetical protein Pmani_026789 [Petrolisthes manimaculis]
MGFTENSAKKAISVTGGGGVEQAMEWLLAHSDDPGINDPPAVEPQATGQDTTEDERGGKEGEGSSKEGEGSSKEGEGSSKEGEGSSKEGEEGQEGEDAAKSIKCDDCGKLFKTSEEVEFHAVKSGHSNFSESTEEKKALTEEEKLQKKRELESKIKQRRKEREMQEEQEAREREKKRIQMGQQIAERKRAMQELEMKKIAEERKKEKLEDKMARERVKEQIERDRQARKEMFGGNKSEAGATTSAPPAKPVPPPTAAPTTTTQKKEYSTTRLQIFYHSIITPTTTTTTTTTQKKEYSTTRLQIRLPSGTPMVQEFKAKEALSAVRLWISLNRQDGEPADEPVKLSMSFPRKLFSEEDMDKPLDALGLVPSAVLMVSK